MPVNPLPAGYSTVTPYLLVADGQRMVDFVEAGLGGSLRYASRMPDGSIAHAEVQIGDSLVMLGQVRGDHPPMPTMLYVYVEDCDAAYQRAVAAGGEAMVPPADQFYGDRSGTVRDPAGNWWCLATHVEDVPADQMESRWKAEQARRAGG